MSAQGNADIKLKQVVINKMSSRGIRTPCNITVSINSGEVTLTGTVTQAHQKTAAGSIATGTAGVKRVINQLTVQAAEKRRE